MAHKFNKGDIAVRNTSVSIGVIEPYLIKIVRVRKGKYKIKYLLSKEKDSFTIKFIDKHFDLSLKTVLKKL